MKNVRGIYPILIFVLLITGFCRPGFCQSEIEDKATILKRVANDWIAIGMEEYGRGMYLQAEKAFLAAREYYLYLNREEREKLEEYSEMTHKAYLQVMGLSTKVDKARQLFKEGKLIEAKQVLEQIYDSEYLTATQQREFALPAMQQQIDSAIRSRRKQANALFESSIQAYRAVELESAKKGFAEVAESRFVPSAQRSAAEGYIERIERLLEKESTPLIGVERLLLPEPGSEQPGQQRSEQGQQQPTASTEKSVTARTEPEVLKPQTVKVEPTSQPSEEELTRKEKLLRSYSEAVINDATEKTKSFIESGDFYKAKQALRKAGKIIEDNRKYLGEELYRKYMQQLIDLGRQMQQQ
ncbi:hypothetical protein ACFL1G_08010 [Planctomycetota bacterium]